MGSFQGEVVLLVGGDSIACQAELGAHPINLSHLGVEGLVEWWGILSGFTNEQWERVAYRPSVQPLRLQLPNGGDGEVVIYAERDKLLSFEVRGIEEPPF